MRTNSLRQLLLIAALVHVQFNGFAQSYSDTLICKGSSATIGLNTSQFTPLVCDNSGLPANLKTDLVVYFPFCGNANDISGNGRNGTVYGATLTEDRFGNPNSAYNFSNLTDYIAVGPSLYMTKPTISISVWFKSNETNMGYIIGTGNQNAYALSVNYGTRDSLCLFSELTTLCCGHSTLTSVSRANTNEWKHAVLVFDDQTTKLYINGVLEDQNLYSGGMLNTPQGNHFLSIGGYFLNGSIYPYDNFSYKGIIDDLAIWNRALTDQEVLQLEKAGSVSWSNAATSPTIDVQPLLTTTYYASVWNGVRTYTDTFHVQVQDLSSYNSLPDSLLLNTLPVTLNANSGFAAYSWNNGSSSQTLSATATGKYVVTVTSPEGCSAKDSTLIFLRPQPLSINRQNPIDSLTAATQVVFRCSFSKAILGVDLADFSISTTGNATGTISLVSKINDSTYDITIASLSGSGNLRLDLKASNTAITDKDGIAISSGYSNGQLYTLNGPSIKCPANITVSAAAGRCNQTVAFTGSNAVTVTGVTNPIITYVPASGTAFNVGTTKVTATVKSGTTTVGTCSFTVTVTDAQLPTVSALTVSPVILAPADHTLKTINLTYTATDNCTTVTSVVSVTSNEPDAGTGDGDLPGDIVIVNNKQVQLRAEKTPGSTARVYTITLTVKDAAGNTVIKTAQVRMAHEIKSPKSGSCYPPNTTVSFGGEYWDGAGLTHTATWSADATSIAGTDVEPKQGTSTENGGTTNTTPVNGTVAGSYRFTTAGVYKMKMNLKDNKNVTTTADQTNNIGELVVIYGNTGTYSYGGGCMEVPAGSLVAKPTVSGKASFGFTVSGASATTGKGEVQLEFRIGAWEFNTATITNYTISGAKLTMSGTGKVTGVTTTYNYTLTAIDGNHPLGGGTDKVRLRVTTTAGAVIFDNNPGALATADPSTAVCTGLGQVYVPGGAAVGALESPSAIIGLAQEVLPFEIKASPNPSSSIFRVSCVGNSNNMKLMVMDVSGRVLERFTGVNSNQVIELGRNYKPGLYLVRLEGSDRSAQLKIVKLTP